MWCSAVGCIMMLTLSLLAAPLTAEAQPAGKIYHLGILSPAAVPAPSVATIPNLVPMALRELGYVEGGNLVIERRFAAGKLDRLPELARELVQLRMDVIVAVSSAAIDAAKDATVTIPIVMGFSDDDPVKRGYMASLTRPEGDNTGITLAAGTMLASKRLELLKATLPQRQADRRARHGRRTRLSRAGAGGTEGGVRPRRHTHRGRDAGDGLRPCLRDNGGGRRGLALRPRQHHFQSRPQADH